MSPSCEERPRTGDKCQMVESVAFFEAYRPVLEGLQTMSCMEFPFEVTIVFLSYFLIDWWRRKLEQFNCFLE